MTSRPKPFPGRFRSRLVHLFFLATRPMTLGVRAAVFDDHGRVFLVRHSYVPGWHFPGGGVERRETALDALARELKEEGNIFAEEEAQLFGLYLNSSVSGRDHVAFYILRRFRQSAPRGADAEILETGFFSPGALPQGASRATKARLAEILDGVKIGGIW